MSEQRYDWDIFCTVVDNYGDIGVTLRLARQLTTEYQQKVRLWVDDLASCARICPGVDVHRVQQQYAGITLCLWQAKPQGGAEPVIPAYNVIEAFACELPEYFRAQMRQCTVAPCWLNLEYLSAEPWVEGCHALPSLQSDGLTKHFFFPGFTAKTGGLLREQGLLAAREQWQADLHAIGCYWEDRGIMPKCENEQWISLFTYENPALLTLIQYWADAEKPVRCLVPEGRTLTYLTEQLALPALHAGDHWCNGHLRLEVLPFTDQAGFDRLLWSCDLNFIRGEDSFIRAQWAGVPFIWHIYPQEEQAHIEKLDAFLTRYLEAWPTALAEPMRQFCQGYNAGQCELKAWSTLDNEYDLLKKQALEWANTLALTEDLACQLVKFSQSS